MKISARRHALAGLAGLAALLLVGGASFAQNVADVPRNETLVLTPWGDQPAQLANVENWNPYLTSVTHQRDAMQFTVNEELFYTNLTDGKLIPWQAESFDLSPDFMTATIHLRKGRDLERRPALHLRRREVHARGAARRAPRDQRLVGLQGICAERGCARSADGRHPLHQARAALVCATISRSATRTITRSCPSTSGRARTSRPSPITTSPRACGRHRRLQARELDHAAGGVRPRRQLVGGQERFRPAAGAQAHHRRAGGLRRRHGPAADRQPGGWRPATAGRHLRGGAGAEPQARLVEYPGAGLGGAGRLRLFAGLQQPQGAVERRQPALGGGPRHRPGQALRHRL